MTTALTVGACLGLAVAVALWTWIVAIAAYKRGVEDGVRLRKSEKENTP